MNRYTVVWWQKAEDELAELWLGTDDRAPVTADAREIDRRLGEQASEWGSEITAEVRWMELSMLRAYFKISELDRRVDVVSVVTRTSGSNESRSTEDGSG